MKIFIQSNFVVPGLDGKEVLELEATEIKLRDFLEELSSRAPMRIEYIRNGIIDPDEWEIEVNGIPYSKCKEGLDTLLKDNDQVTIKIMALGGG